MKKFLALLFLGLCLNPVMNYAMAASCGGECVNESSNRFFDKYCEARGQVAGAQGCYKAANMGCTWYGRRLVRSGGSCVNESSNPFFDKYCEARGQVAGAQGCYKAAKLGCTWYGPSARCQ